MFSTSARRLAALAAATVAGVVALAGTASAHVTVNPKEADQGGYARLTFRVPNESDTAGTVKVQVNFPTDNPLASVRYKPHAGWTITVTKTKLPKPVDVGDYDLTEAVSAITWTAQSGVQIKPGEFDEFDVSVGPLPEAKSLAFPAVQTYSDGKVVNWNEPVPAGGEEPEHPAPTLTLNPAAAEGDGHGHGGTGAAATESPTPVPATDQEPVSNDSTVAANDGTARALGTAGLVVGVVGLALAAFAFLTRRRNAA
jgi:periplasmic copper chaperone A